MSYASIASGQKITEKEDSSSSSEEVTLPSSTPLIADDDGFTVVCRRQRTKPKEKAPVGNTTDTIKPVSPTSSHTYNRQQGERSHYQREYQNNYQRRGGPSRGRAAPSRGAGRRVPSAPHYSREERDRHKAALGRVRTQVLAELQLDQKWMITRLKEMRFIIDPRTGAAYTGYFESFARIRLQQLNLAGETKTVRELKDEILDSETGHKFSRKQFYENYYFQSELVDYYWDLLKTDTTYCPVKIAYYHGNPHLKIGFPTRCEEQQQQPTREATQVVEAEAAASSSGEEA